MNSKKLRFDNMQTNLDDQRNIQDLQFNDTRYTITDMNEKREPTEVILQRIKILTATKNSLSEELDSLVESNRTLEYSIEKEKSNIVFL